MFNNAQELARTFSFCSLQCWVQMVHNETKVRNEYIFILPNDLWNVDHTWSSSLSSLRNGSLNALLHTMVGVLILFCTF
jgi:hypothetical protein